MTDIGDHGRQQSIATVDRVRVSIGLFHPEEAIDELPHGRCSRLVDSCEVLGAEKRKDFGPTLVRVDAVSLHLDEGDGRLRATPVRKRNSRARVLPPLIEQAPRSATLVAHGLRSLFAPHVDPGKRRLDRRTKFLKERAVGCKPMGRLGDDDEKRRGIDAAVVGGMRDLAAAGHLAKAQLVKDLARLFFRHTVEPLSLVRREGAQRVGREIRVERQRLVTGNQCVPSERRAKPRDPRADDGMVIELYAQSVQVESGLVQDVLQQAVVAGVARRARAKHLHLVRMRLGAAREREARPAARDATDHGNDTHFNREAAVRRKTQLEQRMVLRQVGGARTERDDGLVPGLAQTRVRENDGAPLDSWPVHRAASGALSPANLEDVCEIDAKSNQDFELARAHQEIRENHLLDQTTIEKLPAADVQKVFRVVEQLLVLVAAHHEIDLVVRAVRRFGAQTDGTVAADVQLVVR